MKTDLLKRLEKIEQKTDPDGISAIFINLRSKERDPKNVAGWSFSNSDGEQVEVYRQASESLEDLGSRAAALAREHLGKDRIPLLLQLV